MNWLAIVLIVFVAFSWLMTLALCRRPVSATRWPPDRPTNAVPPSSVRRTDREQHRTVMGLQMPCGQRQREGRARLPRGPRGRRRHRSYPKIATIVNVTELSERTVRTALKTLQERGSSAVATNGTRASARAAGTVCPSTARSCGTSRSNPTRRPSNGSRRRTRRNTTRRPWAIPWTPPPPPSWKTANPRTCCRKTLERSRFPALQISQGWKRAGTGTANPAGPALRELHPQHCKCRTPSTANLAELHI